MFHGYPTISAEPRPPAVVPSADIQRWEESARRRRMLSGTWRPDLEDRMKRLINTTRLNAWGEISLSINPLANITRVLSVLYDTPPDIRHDTAGTDGITGAMRSAGTWPMMQSVQQFTLGLGNMLVRVNASTSGRITTRPVFPDLVYAEATAERPDVPVLIHEFRVRSIGGDDVWTIDVLDIRDPDLPVYEVRRITQSKPRKPRASVVTEFTDITQSILAGERPEGEPVPEFSMSGDAYPYRRRDGRPVLPYVMYHAQRNGYKLWQPYERMELVEGTLDAAVLHQMLMHVWKDASWPQRWVANLIPSAGSARMSSDGMTATEVITDPASVVILETPRDVDNDAPTGQPMVGQWKPGGDIQVMEAGIANFVARLAQSADVPPSDIQRMTGQAQSGAAISLTNEGKRAAQKRYAESFRDSDERLVGLCAILANRATAGTPSATNYTEGGYRVVYREIPVSPEERNARRAEALEMLEARLASPEAAIRIIYPEMSETDAAAAIADAVAPRTEPEPANTRTDPEAT